MAILSVYSQFSTPMAAITLHSDEQIKSKPRVISLIAPYQKVPILVLDK